MPVRKLNTKINMNTYNEYAKEIKKETKINTIKGNAMRIQRNCKWTNTKYANLFIKKIPRKLHVHKFHENKHKILRLQRNFTVNLQRKQINIINEHESRITNKTNTNTTTYSITY